MINREKEQLENRQRVSDGVVAATRSLGLLPREQDLIRQVTMGELPLVTVDERVVAALYKAAVLASCLLVRGDLEAPGWKHIEMRREPAASPFGSPSATEQPNRVMGYYVREPGLGYSMDVGGELFLEVALGENHSRDYTRWRLTWTPRGTPYTPPISPENLRLTNPRSPRIAKPKIVEPASVPPPILETPPEKPAGDVLNTRTDERGTLLRNADGEPVKDAEGRLRVAFPDGGTRLIPKSLIGTVYKIETSI